MPEINIESYGESCAELLSGDFLAPLGPGRPNLEFQKSLEELTLERLFPSGYKRRQMAQAALSGLWLLHGFLDESHTISQDIPSSTGSYWHGIMHRREPDYSNAKYWFRKVGDHPVFPDVLIAAVEIIENAGDDVDPHIMDVCKADCWDPFQFIDLCASAANRPSMELHLRQIAQAEWKVLFHYSYQAAIGNALSQSFRSCSKDRKLDRYTYYPLKARHRSYDVPISVSEWAPFERRSVAGGTTMYMSVVWYGVCYSGAACCSCSRVTNGWHTTGTGADCG